jgi:hypothetical protein
MDENVEKSRVVVAPFYWQYSARHTGEEPARLERNITLWPFATWRRRLDGSRDFWIISHGWTDESGGAKRNYRAVFDLFQYHSKPGGETETRLLSRLYHHRRGARGRYLSVGPLFTYDSIGDVVGEEGKYFSALLGLVKRSWTADGSRWRIFYIPLGGG